MKQRTAVVLGIKPASFKLLEEQLSSDFEVQNYLPERQMTASDVVIANPLYEAPSMHQHMVEQVRTAVGDDVPLLILTESERPQRHFARVNRPDGRVAMVERSIDAIISTVARIVVPGTSPSRLDAHQ